MLIRHLCLFIGAFLIVSCANSDDGNKTLGGDRTTLEEKLDGARILVFSRTTEFRHPSIPTGIAAIEKLGSENGFEVVATEDPSQFNDDVLKSFDAVVFLSTTGDVLNSRQELAFERYIQAGGGFVGIHSAVDTEWKEDPWFWYRELVGAVFYAHPMSPSNVQSGRLRVEDAKHISTNKLPATYVRADEWYDFVDLRPHLNHLISIDENSYEGGTMGMGVRHPISWYQDFDGGRSFYTCMGDTIETYRDPFFLDHILGGIAYAVGEERTRNYDNVRPAESRFNKTVLNSDLAEPLGFDFLASGEIIIVERRGGVKRYNRETGEAPLIATLPVSSYNEFGLVAIAIREEQGEEVAYLHYTYENNDEGWGQRVSRFPATGPSAFALDQEQIILEFPWSEECCHTGGDLAFMADGSLLIATGDNTNPHASDGFAPIDFRDGEASGDASRTSGNPFSFAGKVLRILPNKGEPGYTIPEGNLFTDQSSGLPEVYLMGTRNPYSLSVDIDGSVYFGDVGPDGGDSDPSRGLKGHDEINRATGPGNFGWPFFIAANRPYRAYDFATKESGKAFDPLMPYNLSPRLDEPTLLPPAQPALIAYPYAMSDEFPELGAGARNALVVDVYRRPKEPAENAYPSYYEGKLFISDFMRRWIKVVSFRENGEIDKIEPFIDGGILEAPIDLKFGPDGQIYAVEYGEQWFTDNTNAALTRVSYMSDEQIPPKAIISLDKGRGGAPFSLVASSEQSADVDGGKLDVVWRLARSNDSVDSNRLITEAIADPLIEVASPSINTLIEEPGIYVLQLEATANNGLKSYAVETLAVGNEPPKISISIDGNASFFKPQQKSLAYSVDVMDTEDGRLSMGDIPAEAVTVALDFAPLTINGEPLVEEGGHKSAKIETIPMEEGLALITENGCTSCHQVNDDSVGPSYQAVANRYRDRPDVVSYLKGRIKNGAQGNWGDRVMGGFSAIPEGELDRIATFIAGLGGADDSNATAQTVDGRLIPVSGDAFIDQHDDAIVSHKFIGTTLAGEYTLKASYTDKGGKGVPPIEVAETRKLLAPRVATVPLAAKGKSYGVSVYAEGGGKVTLFNQNNSYLELGTFDLTNIAKIKVGQFDIPISLPKDRVFEIRKDGPDGPVIGSSVYGKGFSLIPKYAPVTVDIDAQQGFTNLYLVIRKDGEFDGMMAGVHHVEFVFAQG
ncbi:MAG: ThuA domain-containing protein [Pseudomonadota bacterium]